MAVFTTPFEGRDNVIAPAVYTGLDLRLYTNAANSLTNSTVLADLTYPSGSGYATVSLTGDWTSQNGVVTYVSNVTFTAGDDWTGGDVVGVALTDGTYILHTKDLGLGPVTMTTGEILEVDLSTFVSV
jgi:hypothetical protein